MKYRDLVNTKIQRIENDLKVLRSIVRTQQPIKSYIETLARTEEHLEELKGLISIEPVTNNEVAD
tara:strand:+ start:83 stop:277 length:195 start_codon:yes stop_codon:yes gene_type:complete